MGQRCPSTGRQRFKERLGCLGRSSGCQQQLALYPTKGDDRDTITMAIDLAEKATENTFHLRHALISSHRTTRIHHQDVEMLRWCAAEFEHPVLAADEQG